ncbi:MAG: hypothetical protein JW809_14805 [Pirellulales bacterium]|nr:hypothetical protein [Pirellulales bacterium]
MRNNAAELSRHQKRVLAALAALAKRHGWRWWSRRAIGHVVAAGEYHATIQIETIAALKRAGLVRSQCNSWSESMRRDVRCACARRLWGLTDAGARVAAQTPVVLVGDAETRIAATLRFFDRPMEYDYEDEVEFWLAVRRGQPDEADGAANDCG